MYADSKIIITAKTPLINTKIIESTKNKITSIKLCSYAI